MLKKQLSGIAFISVMLLPCTSTAGNINWQLSNYKSAYSNDELHSIIRQGIEDSKTKTDLKKPWILHVLVEGGSMNDREAEPGLIMIEKAKGAGKDGFTVRCRKFQYGTYTKSELRTRLYEFTNETAGFVTSNHQCL